MIKLKVEGMEEIDKQLAKLPLEIRQEVLINGMRKASQVVASRAKELAPPPGYPGDKKGIPALKKSITYKVVEFPSAIVAVIGPNRKTRHGHLVEKGHALVKHGTREDTGKTAGITAAGRRWIESQGIRQAGPGSQYWFDKAGNKMRIGVHFRGTNSRGHNVVIKVRGHGQVIGRVPPHPYLEPASIDTRDAQQKAIIESINKVVLKHGGSTGGGAA